jgi:hypothetical protein
MASLIEWLEAHDKLAGWAQFFGAILALAVTYFTAFAPVWHKKRQLKGAANRLLANGYEVIESYHRTSAYFLPFPLSVRFAALTIKSVAEEVSRFPLFELDDHGGNSLARRLVAAGVTLNGLNLFLEDLASKLDGRPATEEDQKVIREVLVQRLALMQSLIKGETIPRPEPPQSPP